VGIWFIVIRNFVVLMIFVWRLDKDKGWQCNNVEIIIVDQQWVILSDGIFYNHKINVCSLEYSEFMRLLWCLYVFQYIHLIIPVHVI